MSILEIADQQPDEILTYLIDTYWLTIKKLAYTYVKDWNLAEDLTQDVFIKCYKGLATFRGESSYKTWLFQIAVNQCHDFLRSKAFKTLFIIDDLKELLFKRSPSAEQHFFAASEEERLAHAVLELPTKYREVIILFYFEELSLKEIQSLLNLNISTVKTRMNRAKQLLWKSFERDDKYGR